MVTCLSTCSSQCWCSTSGCKLFCISPRLTFSDYDAPLSEAGDITEKYLKTRELILEKVYKPLGVLSVSLPHSLCVCLCLCLFSLWNFGLYKHILCTQCMCDLLPPIQCEVAAASRPWSQKQPLGVDSDDFHFSPEVLSLDLKLSCSYGCLFLCVAWK